MLLNQFGDFMLKNILSVILTSILLTSINTAQIGSWQNFTSMKSVSAFNITQNNIWAATEGGVFMFNRSDSSFTQLTKTEGISSQQLLSITTSSQDEIWVGSTEGYINIIGNDRTITKIFDIVNSNEVLKGINYLSTSGDTVFASIDFGL